MSNRMRLVDAGDSVTIYYHDIDMDKLIRRDFFCSNKRDSYVREHGKNGQVYQVCEQLAGMGHCLSANPTSLATVIRREYRAMRRAEKKWVTS